MCALWLIINYAIWEFYTNMVHDTNGNTRAISPRLFVYKIRVDHEYLVHVKFSNDKYKQIFTAVATTRELNE